MRKEIDMLETLIVDSEVIKTTKNLINTYEYLFFNYL